MVCCAPQGLLVRGIRPSVHRGAPVIDCIPESVALHNGVARFGTLEYGGQRLPTFLGFRSML